LDQFFVQADFMEGDKVFCTARLTFGLRHPGEVQKVTAYSRNRTCSLTQT
jgi:hypothetical protein